MEYTAPPNGNFVPLSGNNAVPEFELGFVCQVIQQYLSMLSPDRRPYFVACITQIMCDALKPPPAPPLPPYSSAERLERPSAHQRQFSIPEADPFTIILPERTGDSNESPTDNIAFRTIPCRNWIKFKGNCRLGSRCKFIHDPDFITDDDNEDEFPASPAPHCWSYLQGTCYKGPLCKYYHPPPAHRKIYQRYTPCREWDSCNRQACPFRHAPSGSVSSKSSPTSFRGFENETPPPSRPVYEPFNPTSAWLGLSSFGSTDEPPLPYRQEEIWNPTPEFQGLSSRAYDGSGKDSSMDVSPFNFNPFASDLDTIQEELGPLSTLGAGIAAGRRRSMCPTQPLKQFDFGGFGNLDSRPLLDDPSPTRPRGKSFDASFMLQTKREQAQNTLF
ncbi:hypothetical protein D9611_009240 [Ephemerocybe angulata]|uniref:C3H1-type domain-containing protein n=1 Tax=Ephemerocybe angulata TaxID=980116 RepID=A0A8H5F449_9AGAR|nr:hypothetical protein D9611_009240 [Tulosesus angulatus]